MTEPAAPSGSPEGEGPDPGPSQATPPEEELSPGATLDDEDVAEPNEPS